MYCRVLVATQLRLLKYEADPDAQDKDCDAQTFRGLGFRGLGVRV